jgi:hypothetical protein
VTVDYREELVRAQVRLEALNEMMKSDGWKVFTAQMDNYVKFLESQMMSAKEPHEVFAWREAIFATKQIISWPMRDCEATVFALKHPPAEED